VWKENWEVALDYGRMLKRAWSIIWENKFLILLGIIVALGSGGRGGGLGSGGGGSSGNGESSYDFPFGDMPALRAEIGFPEVLIGLAALAVISFAFLVAILVWVAATIARGGLIAGVNTIEGGGASSFAAAWYAGWDKGWRLLGIGIAPAIPTFILALAGLATAGVLAGLWGWLGQNVSVAAGIGLGVPFVVLACILVPIALVLSLLRTFANRACMLEDLGVIASYRRGLDVLVANIGPAIVLFLVQVGISIALGLVLFLPGLLMVLCCILWPVLLAIKGTVTSYFSTLWTLAWREWVG
jgi:hypothetical protein